MAKLVWSIAASSAAKQVKAALSTSKRLHTQLDVASKSALVNMLVHKNADPMNDLLNGLNKTSIHVKGLKAWLEKFGNGVTVAEKEGRMKVAWPKDYKQLEATVALAKATKLPSFWTFAPPPNPFDKWVFADELAKLLKKAEEMERAKKEGTMKKGKEITELTDEQRAAIDLTNFHEVLTAIKGGQPKVGIISESQLH